VNPPTIKATIVPTSNKLLIERDAFEGRGQHLFETADGALVVLVADEDRRTAMKRCEAKRITHLFPALPKQNDGRIWARPAMILVPESDIVRPIIESHMFLITHWPPTLSTANRFTLLVVRLEPKPRRAVFGSGKLCGHPASEPATEFYLSTADSTPSVRNSLR